MNPLTALTALSVFTASKSKSAAFAPNPNFRNVSPRSIQPITNNPSSNIFGVQTPAPSLRQPDTALNSKLMDRLFGEDRKQPDRSPRLKDSTPDSKHSGQVDKTPQDESTPFFARSTDPDTTQSKAQDESSSGKQHSGDKLTEKTDAKSRETEQKSDKPGPVYLSDSLRKAIEARRAQLPTQLKPETPKEQSQSVARQESGNTKAQPYIPPKDPEIAKMTDQIIGALNKMKGTSRPILEKVLNSMSSAVTSTIPKDSITATLILQILNMAEADNDPEGQKEFLYLLLRAISILDKTAQISDNTNKTPISLSESIFKESIESLISSLNLSNGFGLFNLYKGMFEAVLGEDNWIYSLASSFQDNFLKGLSDEQDEGGEVRKLLQSAIESSTKDRIAWLDNRVEAIKSSLIDNLGREEVNSLATKIKRVITLFFIIDTKQDVAKEYQVKAFHELGVIFSKAAQTLGGQALNRFFQDEGPFQRLIETCLELQRNGVPMTAAEADAQMAMDFGPNWQEEIFQEFCLEPIPDGVGTIACVYPGVTAEGKEAVVKIAKPLGEQLAMEEVQVGQLIRGFLDIVQEIIYSFQRLDREVPKLISSASLFQTTQEATEDFLKTIKDELNLEAEAQAMNSTSVLTPEIFGSSKNAIIMERIPDPIRYLEYIKINEKTKDNDYGSLATPIDAVKGWLENHHPFDIKKIHSTNTGRRDTYNIEVTFEDQKIKSFNFTVKKSKDQWKIKPNRPFIDFSTKQRDKFAIAPLYNLLKQVKEGVFNADPHGGNFLISADHFYSIDYGLRGEITQSVEGEIIRKLMIGILAKNPKEAAASYIDMTEKGQSLSPSEYRNLVEEFADHLKENDYFNLLFEKPDISVGLVMEWLPMHDLSLASKYIKLSRSFAGVASTFASLQGGKGLTLEQWNMLSQEALWTQFPGAKAKLDRLMDNLQP